MRICAFCSKKHYIGPFWRCERCGAPLPTEGELSNRSDDEQETLDTTLGETEEEGEYATSPTQARTDLGT
jgi:hypothetical protein